MAKILYSATAADGSKTEGFVDAMSAASARDDLVRQGLRDVVLHQEPAVPQAASELDGLTRAQVRALAQFKLRLLRAPGLATVLAEVARQLRWLLLLDVLLIAWALQTGRSAWVAGLVFAALLPFALTLWRWRHAGRYDQLLKACALGDWAAVRRLAPLLRAVSKKTAGLDFDLDIRLAAADAAEGGLAQAGAGLEHWRVQLAGQPGLFECRLAAVVLAGGDSAGYVRLMGEAAERAAGDPSRTLDHALAQARLGDVAQAARLLGSIDTTLLPPHGKGYALWVRGLVQLRQQHPDGLATLGAAVAEFLQLAKHPAAWPSLAFCACDHAVALNLAGQSARARRQIADVWPVLGAHAPKALLRMLDGDGLLPRQATQNFTR
jgi:hypothetical protein